MSQEKYFTNRVTVLTLLNCAVHAKKKYSDLKTQEITTLMDQLCHSAIPKRVKV